MRRQFKLAVVLGFLSPFLQAALLPMGSMVSFQRAFTIASSTSPVAEGCVVKGTFHCLPKKAIWLNEQRLKIHRGNTALEEMNSKCYRVAGNYFPYDFYWFSPFPNIQLSHPEENPQAPILQRTFSCHGLLQRLLSFTSMPFYLKINMWCHSLNYNQLSSEFEL